MAARPDSQAQELLEQGAGLYEEGKLYEALSCWKQVLELDPGNEIAAEYLRFIEDNFQIGVDAFIEHHSDVMTTPPQPDNGGMPPVASPPPQVAPHGTPPPMVGPPPPPEPHDESIEELDWSELLEEGSPAPPTPPPMPVSLPSDGDEDFFSEPPPGSLDVPPGEEAEAWGASAEDDVERSELADIDESGPIEDPLALPTSHFAAAYKPPQSAGHGSVSQEIGPDDSRRRRRSSPENAILVAPDLSPSEVSPPERNVILEPRKDLELMSDDSIEMMLDEDFRAWEDDGSTPLPDDSTDLEAMLSAGISNPSTPSIDAQQSSPSTQVYESPEPRPAALPGEVEAVEAEPEHAPVDDLDALLQAGLADISAIESGDAPSMPPRQLMKRPPPGTDLDALMAGARQKQQAGDFSGSLALVEDVLAGNPEHEEARGYLAENTTRLLAMYRSKLGNVRRSPRVKLRPQEIIWQSLDHRAGFILSQVDGLTSYEDIIEISGMTELEATRVLARLVEHGVIG